MSTDKPFLSIDNQIRQLHDDRKLIFHSEANAKRLLSQYGYYEIINGYKDHFMVNPQNDELGFKEGTTFEHIYALFEFDRDLRESTMNALEIFESTLRQVVAYTIAENISDESAKYIQRYHYNSGRKYFNKRHHKYVYPVEDLLRTMKGICRSDAQPYKHYREKHGNVPPWILVKKLTFGNLIWLTKLLKRPEKNLVISRMLNLPITYINAVPDINVMFGALLTLYLNYRNTAAHGARIYNHQSKKYALPYLSILQPGLDVTPADYRHDKGQSHFGVVLRTLQLFENNSAYIRLLIGLQTSLERYIEVYPNDEAFLMNQMEISLDWYNSEKYQP